MKLRHALLAFVAGSAFLAGTAYADTISIVAGATDVGLWITKQLRELPKIIHVGKVVGFEGQLVLDATKKDGTMRKLLDISRIKATGWSPKVSLEEGLKRTYEIMQMELAEDGIVKK